MDEASITSNPINSGVEPTQNFSVPPKENEENAVKQQKNSRVFGKPFVKGDPRINRKGAPKKVTIWDYLEEDEDKEKIRDFINDPKFRDKVAEYILGKPKQPLVGGDDDEPIKITGINYIKPNGNNSATDNQTGSSL